MEELITEKGCRVSVTFPPEPSSSNVVLSLRMVDPADSRQAYLPLTKYEVAQLVELLQKVQRVKKPITVSIQEDV